MKSHPFRVTPRILSTPMSIREEDAQRFYEKWKDHVHTFCAMFLGNGERAEEITAACFGIYFQNGNLDFEHLPPHLMGVALRRAELERSRLPVYSLEVKPHEDNLLYLPPPQRAVFIMRALGMEDASISVAMSLTVEQVRGLWINSLVRLRQVLPPQFFKGRTSS